MKRILTLDGGGIRGVFSLQILKQIEKEFRREYNKPKLVLREVFDLFAGTSTGAIIAAFLAWGKSVEEIERLYIDRAEEMFTPAPLHQRYKSKYSSDAIAKFFKEQFCEDKGTAAKLNTRKFYENEKATIPKYLVIVMRNATTGASWPVSNNPEAVHNKTLTDPADVLKIPLWQLLRASTAAPTFFQPEEIKLNKRTHIFMDGGITPYNNPALIAVLMATLPSYHINWETGPDKILLVSIGTGHSRIRLAHTVAESVNWAEQAAYAVPALLHTVAKEQDKICRVLGHSVYGKETDDEQSDPNQSTRLLTPAEKKFAYIRYNHEFTRAEEREANQICNKRFSLQNQLRAAFIKDNTGQSLAMDNLDLIEFLQRTGGAYAEKAVKRQHLFPKLV